MFLFFLFGVNPIENKTLCCNLKTKQCSHYTTVSCFPEICRIMSINIQCDDELMMYKYILIEVFLFQICFLFFVLWSKRSKQFKCTPTQHPMHWVLDLFLPPTTALLEQTTQSFSFLLASFPIW